MINYCNCIVLLQGSLEESFTKLEELVQTKLIGTPFKLSKNAESELRVESVIVQVCLNFVEKI